MVTNGGRLVLEGSHSSSDGDLMIHYDLPIRWSLMASGRSTPFGLVKAHGLHDSHQSVAMPNGNPGITT